MPEKPPKSRQSPKSGIVQMAKALGVSPSMISRALRPETAHLVNAVQRKRILALAEREQFLPNPGARMMRKGFNSTLTVVVPLDENIFFSEFYARFLAGTIHAAAARSWEVHIRTTHTTPAGDNFRETLQYLGLNSAGLIYLGGPLSETEIAELRGYRRPLVLAKASLPPGIALQDVDVPVVGVNNREGAGAAVALLQQLGHKHIGFLQGPSGSRDACERREGYHAAMAAGGMPVRSTWEHECSFNADGGRAGMERILREAERPTAICCASDDIAFGALTALQGAGLRCPDDVSLVGFDDGLWATNCRPSLTTVRQPLAEMTERAVSLLLETARSETRAHVLRASEIPTALVIRDSTRAI